MPFRCSNETLLINSGGQIDTVSYAHHQNMATKTTLTKLTAATNNNEICNINTIMQSDQRQQQQQLHNTHCDMIDQTPKESGANALNVDQNNKTDNNGDLKHRLLVGSQPMHANNNSQSSAFGKFY